MKKPQDIQLMNGFNSQPNFGHSHQHLKISLTFKLCSNLEKMKKSKLKLTSLFKNTTKTYGKPKQEKILKIY